MPEYGAIAIEPIRSSHELKVPRVEPEIRLFNHLMSTLPTLLPLKEATQCTFNVDNSRPSQVVILGRSETLAQAASDRPPCAL